MGTIKGLFEVSNYVVDIDNDDLLVYVNTKNKGLKIEFYKNEKGCCIKGFNLITPDLLELIKMQFEEFNWC